MTNIVIGRYGKGEGVVTKDGTVEKEWQGWIEDEERTWIAFIDKRGRPTFYLHRDADGGVIESD